MCLIALLLIDLHVHKLINWRGPRNRIDRQYHRQPFPHDRRKEIAWGKWVRRKIKWKRITSFWKEPILIVQKLISKNGTSDSEYLDVFEKKEMHFCQILFFQELQECNSFWVMQYALKTNIIWTVGKLIQGNTPCWMVSPGGVYLIGTSPSLGNFKVEKCMLKMLLKERDDV